MLGPVWTAIHEGSHALAVIAQGGSIETIHLLPTAACGFERAFGCIETAGVTNEAAMSLAPVGVAIALLATGPIVLARAKPHFLTRLAVLFAVVFPVGELALSAGAIRCAPADLGKLLHDDALFWMPLLYLIAGSLWIGARAAFERLFEVDLSFTEYCGLGLLLLSMPWIVGPVVRLLP